MTPQLMRMVCWSIFFSGALVAVFLLMFRPVGNWIDQAAAAAILLFDFIAIMIIRRAQSGNSSGNTNTDR